MTSLRDALGQSQKQWATKINVFGSYPTSVIRQSDGTWQVWQHRLGNVEYAEIYPSIDDVERWLSDAQGGNEATNGWLPIEQGPQEVHLTTPLTGGMGQRYSPHTASELDDSTVVMHQQADSRQRYCGVCRTHVVAEGHTHSTKPCQVCGKVKPLAAFPIHASSIDGHRRSCVDCIAAKKAEDQAQRLSAKEKSADRSRKRELDRQLLRTHGYRWSKVIRQEQGWDGDLVEYREWVLLTSTGEEVTLEAALEAIKTANPTQPIAASTIDEKRARVASTSHSSPLAAPGWQAAPPHHRPLSLPHGPLPPLQGTDRQVRWAAVLRARRLSALRRSLSIGEVLQDVPDVRLRLACLVRLTDAHWWIEQRDATDGELLRSVKTTTKYQTKRPNARTREEAITQASNLVNSPTTLVLDTETTGRGPDDAIVEIALLAGDGTVVLNTLVNPQRPIPDDAAAKHGITDAMVANAPIFADIWPFLCAVLRTSEYLAVYNAQFDMTLIRSIATKLKQDDTTVPSCPYREADCLMYQYAAFRGNPGRIVSLEVACQECSIMSAPTHRALSDCRAALDLLRHMASFQDELMPF